MRVRILCAALSVLAVVSLTGAGGSALAQPLVPLDTFWIRHYVGDTSPNLCWNQGADIVYDTSRYIVYAGGSGNGMYPNNSDILVAAYSDVGTFIESRAIGGSVLEDVDIAHGLALDAAGKVYFTGSTFNDFTRDWDATSAQLLFRTDTIWPQESIIRCWYKSIYYREDYSYDLALGTRNDLYICGTADTTARGYIGTCLAVTRLLRTNPMRVWTKFFVLDSLALGMGRRRQLDMHPSFWEDEEWGWLDNCATAIVRAPNNGNYVITGFGMSADYARQWWTMELDTAGNMLWNKTFRDTLSIQGADIDEDVALDVAVASDGRVYVCGFTHRDQGPRDDDDFAVVCYDDTGKFIASRIINGPASGDDYAFSLCLDDASPQNVYVTGTMDAGLTGGNQIFTAKFNSALVPQWSNGSYVGAPWGATSGTAYDRGYKVVYNTGRVYVAGRRGDPLGDTLGNDDIAVLCYTTANSASKDTLWGRFFAHPDGGTDYASGIHVTDSNNIYVTGQCARTGMSPWSSMWVARYGHLYKDVRAVQLLSPPASVLLGDSFRPIVRVQNVGTVTATFPVRIRIWPLGQPANYFDTTFNVLLRPGAYINDTCLRWWKPAATGGYVVKCSTAFDGDLVQPNNFIQDTIYVTGSGGDVGVFMVLAPTGTLEYGAVVAPVCSVRNYNGTAQPAVPVSMVIAGVRVDTVITLAGNARTRIVWPAWTAAPPGWDSVYSFTWLAGDAQRNNDTTKLRVRVRGRDVRVNAMMPLAPPESVDAGTSVPVQVIVQNTRTDVSVPSVPLLVRIGATYSQTTSFALAANQTDTIALPNWNPVGQGWNFIKCSLYVAGDTLFANDTLKDSSYVRGPDVGVTAIFAPTGTVDMGAIITPQVRVQNFRAVAMTGVPVRLDIGAWSDLRVIDLAASQIDTIAFTNWTASPPGVLPVTGYTQMLGDVNRTNDTSRTTVTVLAPDVGVTAILAPVGNVDLGAIIAPQAVVRNYRSVAVASVPVTFHIQGGYQSTINVALAGNQIDTVAFANWTATPVGLLRESCFTFLATDANRGNDTAKSTVTVLAPDCGVTAILAPVGNVDLGATIAPQAVVRNYRASAINVPVTFHIGGGYQSTVNVPLAGSQIDTVIFTNWTATPLGLLRESCFTQLATDADRTNDTARNTVTVLAPDVGVSLLLQPTGVLEYGTVVTPRARVKNYRSVTQLNVPVRFQIAPGYTDDTTVAVPGYDSLTIDFASWTAAPPGALRESVFTRLPTDANRNNDTARLGLWVRGRDVGVTAILSPPDSSDLGGVYTPQAVVRNYRSVAIPVVPVRMYIGAGYMNIVNVALAPNQIDTVDFPAWNAAAPGAFTVRCTLAVPADTFFPNDTMSRVTIVRGPDVGAFRILAPSGTYVPGVVITPQTRVRNYRAVAQPAVPVRLRIGAGYQRDTTVAIPANDSVTIFFANWTANPPGMHVVKCSTRLLTDVFPPNDAVTDTVFVASRDVACLRIVAPVGTVDQGANVTPQAWIRNFGNTPEVFDCWLRIGGFYADTVSVTLAAGDSVLRSFQPVTLTQLGRWAVVCSTMLSADLVPANDRAVDSVLVRLFDVAARAIVAPADTVDSGTVVVPQLRVANLGSTQQTFWTHFRFQPIAIPSFYNESVQVTLAASAESVLTYPPSLPVDRFGSWRMQGWCSAGDPAPSNDSVSGYFYVPGRGGISWPHGWSEVAPLPPLPSLRAVKDGGALTVMEDTGVGLIYATKGNKTAEFFAYNCRSNTWSPALAPIPSGREGKLTGKGTQLCADGAGSIYLTKGNNTLGWYRYSVASDSWTQLVDVPVGMARVKGGTDMAFVVKNDVGYVYLLKGYKNEFYRFNTARDSWETMDLAPGTVKWDKGSFLVYDLGRTIYAHKARYHELWSYDTDQDTWGQMLAGMPFYGRLAKKKKSKDGGSGAWFPDSSTLYAFKGGNTPEYWRYLPARDSWYEDDTIPMVGSSGKKKKVKNGGDLVYNALACWGLKGNKTLEFWRYGILRTEAPVLAPKIERSGVAGQPAPKPGAFGLSPNPLVEGVVYLRGGTGRVLGVSVYDATGRKVWFRALAVAPHATGTQLDLRGLVPGVYLVQVDTGTGRTWTTKLIRR